MNENELEVVEPEAWEELGPDDLELIERTPAVDSDPDDWVDQEAVWRQEEQKRWLMDLVDWTYPDPSRRVVERGPFSAAVFEGETLTLVRFEKHQRFEYFDPSGYTDDQLREKLKTYILFS